MLILATDTTGKALSVALVRDDRLIGEIRLNTGYNHAVTHIPQIEKLLNDCQVKSSEIDLFACTRGPGSFTGTRIGLSTIKAMAYAAGKPALGISTLEALAAPWQPLGPAILCPLLDARNGRVFAAAYQAADLKVLVKPGNYLATAFLDALATALGAPRSAAEPAVQAADGSSIRPIWLIGDGADVFHAVAAQSGVPLPRPVQRLSPIFDVPSAAVIARLAAQAYAAGDPGDPFSLDAEYLSPSAAERLKGGPTP